ncbi:hypothetical protein [Mycolicibacterium brumae]|uniref:Uncharacterized protein n=1 Tax=Mycolicibacterium brumae TaxID=85968 RepID=A0A2G5PAX0_9MYCO|nr:hypothetical protein [Mycolicibacterium brumae]MCV7192956.1 hypothetical protein [Mycolicibacterium brumae]PIB75210.1 hypothetical protein CQY22_010105 [Mycolicibacterium brumae]RWA23545.1 hypothetical protein MBRU_01590 [Mycolicibacterium brumae DSM 44177]UWW08525.1 hypothetical protein L2Z93_001588 [Mycolicibacterium brumae]
MEFWSTLDTTDYQLDPGAQAELDRQWAENGRIAVTTGRGKEKIVIDTDGITAAGDFAPWSAIAGLTAVTDVQSTMSPGMTFTDRAHRLVVVTNEVDRKGQRRTLRPEYSAGLRPPLEQLLPAIRRIAPDLPINDQRTGG